jgi:hypothetical protein
MKKFKQYLDEKGRCWTGYKPVPGKKAFSKDSCVKEEEIEEKVKQPTGDLKSACWKGYTAVGTKEKNGRTVPNCVPVKESKLNPADSHKDYAAKSKVLQDLSRNKDVDQKAVQQRRLDLDKEHSRLKEDRTDDLAKKHIFHMELSKSAPTEHLKKQHNKKAYEYLQKMADIKGMKIPPLKEDGSAGPTNVVGGGAIAGTGGKGGEPGVNLKKKKSVVMMNIIHRNKPK